MIFHQHLSQIVTVCGLLLISGCGIDPADFQIVGNILPPVVVATPQQIDHGDVYPNRYIVAFRVNVGASGRSFRSFEAEHRHHFSLLADSYLSDSGIKDIHFITSIDMSNPGDEQVMEDMSPPHSLQLAWNSGGTLAPEGAISVVEFSDNDTAARILSEWEQRGEIWFAEPDHLSKPDATLLQNPFTTDLAEEYKANGQLHLQSIKVPQALEKLAGKEIDEIRIPVVAVLDSGVDYEHPSLANNIWKNPSPGQSGCPGDEIGCDTTVFNRGKVGVGSPWPYLTSGPSQPCPGDPKDPERSVCMHGTHVAGLVAGKLYGSCPVCQIMPIKIISKVGGKGSASDAAILQGFKYLNLFKSKTNIVRVANSSFGKFVRSRAVAMLVSSLKKSPNEVLVVGAAGNEDSMARSYPAAFSDAIAVAALQQNGAKSSYSNFGPWVDVAAPGGAGGLDGLMSAVPGGGAEAKPGTSMASPLVAGVAGLVLAYDSTRSWKELRRSIIEMADPAIYGADVGDNYNYFYPKLSGESVRRPLLGSGIVDANAALDGTKATGILGGRIARVQRGCSVIGEGGGASTHLPFLIPLFAALVLLARSLFARRGSFP